MKFQQRISLSTAWTVGVLFLLLLVLPTSTHGAPIKPVSVTTRAVIPGQSPADVQRFLASPGNWPKIVTSSVGVVSNEADVSQPLPVGKVVDEIFGLPPILPLSVQWKCTKAVPPSGGSSSSGDNSNSKPKGGFFGIGKPSASESAASITPGRLEFFSSQGLEGVAQNCEMIFNVQEEKSSSSSSSSSNNNNNQAKGTEVSLNMKYEPASILAILAVPILTLDNAVALNFLLPAAMRDSPELDKFRNLMGTLYGFAGLAHLADCVLGPSQLLTMAGAPAFGMLPLEGQLLALLWCFTGPLSFALSKFGGKGYADMGLIVYGLVEVFGAGLISLNYGAVVGDDKLVIMNAFVNAVLVQSVVAAAWFYSSSKKQEQEMA